MSWAMLPTGGDLLADQEITEKIYNSDEKEAYKQTKKIIMTHQKQ